MDVLQSAVRYLDLRRLRAILDEGSHSESGEMDEKLLHNWIKNSGRKQLLGHGERRNIIYMLTNAGLSVNTQDEDGNTPLHLVLIHLHGDPELCEPLLQTGADIYCKNYENKDALELADELPESCKHTRDLFQKYSPGLYKAIEMDDLLSVRKLINLWCRVDITKNGKSLKDLALSKGTEHIIRLILQINPSMKLAHAVLAEDINKVRELLQDKEKPNVNFRNLGDLGATPLFYAIQQNNVEIVELLIENEARSDIIITLEEEDIPILFTALSSETDTEIIKLLIPTEESNFLDLANLHYRGDHVLHFCIKNSVGCVAVRHVLQQGYSSLLALRNSRNECPRDMAVRLNKTDYVKLIDEIVHDWYLDSCGKHRKRLTALGYPHLRDAEKEGVCASDIVQSMETSSPQAQFDTQLIPYQEQIGQLMAAVVLGDLDKVAATENFTSDPADYFVSCLPSCLQKGDGQPALHKAVLHCHLEVAEHIIQTLLRNNIKLDSQRDQFLRTPLHYAYAMENSKHMVNLLMDYGASEFTMDKDLRSPLVFKDYQGHPEMTKLLDWLCYQDFNKAMPDPFSSKLKWQKPTKACSLSHHHHLNKHQHDKHHQQAIKTAVKAPHPVLKVEDLVASDADWSYCTLL